jgi:hypothetical protein
LPAAVCRGGSLRRDNGLPKKDRFLVEMIIKGKSGVLIEDFSDAKKEKEILFGRNSKFGIESIKTTEKKGITGKIKMTLIEL